MNNSNDIITFTEEEKEIIKNHLLEFPLWVIPFGQKKMCPHTHDFMEMVYVRSGKGIHIHGEEQYPINSGDCFIISTGEQHGYQNVNNMNIINILFYPEIIMPQIQHLRKLQGFMDFFSTEPVYRNATNFRYKLHLNPIQQESVLNIIDELVQELQNKHEGYKTLSQGLFFQLVVNIGRYFQNNFSKKNHSSHSFNEENVVSNAISFLERNFDQHVSLQELSSVACLSASRLSYIFKQSTGISLFDYLLNIRLDKAHQLLMNHNLSISEIAFSSGFNDPNYFSRVFKQRTGLSPRQFRTKRK